MPDPYRHPGGRTCNQMVLLAILLTLKAIPRYLADERAKKKEGKGK